jgi:hypothetical protein
VPDTAAADDPELDRPKKKKGRKRSGDEGATTSRKRHRAAYRLLSRALLLHLGATSLFYLGLLLVGLCVAVTLWQRFSIFALPDIPLGGEAVMHEEPVRDREGNVVKFRVIVDWKNKNTRDVYTLDLSKKVLGHRVVAAGAALDDDEDAPLLYLKGALWAALVPIGVATVLDLSLLIVPDLLARLLLLGGLLLRVTIPVVPLLLLGRTPISPALVLLGASVFGCVVCWVTFFRRLGELRGQPGILTEAREMISLGAATVGMLALMVICVLFPYRLFTSGFVWASLCAGVVKMGLVESVLMGLLFPLGIPFLIRYLNLTTGARGSLP